MGNAAKSRVDVSESATSNSSIASAMFHLFVLWSIAKGSAEVGESWASRSLVDASTGTGRAVEAFLQGSALLQVNIDSFQCWKK